MPNTPEKMAAEAMDTLFDKLIERSEWSGKIRESVSGLGDQGEKLSFAPNGLSQKDLAVAGSIGIRRIDDLCSDFYHGGQHPVYIRCRGCTSQGGESSGTKT